MKNSADIMHQLSNTLAGIVSLTELHVDTKDKAVAADLLAIKAAALKAHSLAIKLMRQSEK